MPLVTAAAGATTLLASSAVPMPPTPLADFEMEGDMVFPNVYAGAVLEKDGSINFVD